MKKLITIYLFASMIAISGCHKNGNNQTDGNDGTQQDTLGLTAATLRTEWQTKLTAMDTKELHDQLQKESLQGMEPFNSMAAKEIIARGSKSFDELSVLITKSRSSLLSLMALREIDKEKYGTLADSLKSGVLLDALKNAVTFNTFGLPHVRWEAASKAIIESGEASRPGLYELLKDQRAAPVWGSEDYQEYVRFQYRVCDYAYALLTSKGEPASIPEKQEERDRLIQALIEQHK